MDVYDTVNCERFVWQIDSLFPFLPAIPRNYICTVMSVLNEGFSGKA